jgi:small subunit ribosomal protein S3
VWIYKGEVIESRAEREAAALAQAKAAKADRPRRAPRAPRGEVTKTNVADRAQESASAVSNEATTQATTGEGADA